MITEKSVLDEWQILSWTQFAKQNNIYRLPEKSQIPSQGNA
jgi:hypothetical protein